MYVISHNEDRKDVYILEQNRCFRVPKIKSCPFGEETTVESEDAKLNI
jgi:hypothetical protein